MQNRRKPGGFAARDRDEICDKIKEAGLSLIDSVAVQVPTIEGATVAFECKVVGQFETGDHTVFVGEVVATRGEPQKAEHLYVTSNYEFFSLEGLRVPVDKPYFAAQN